MYKIVTFCVLFTLVRAQGYYKVVGPRAVRPNSEHHVAVAVQAAAGPTAVVATLRGAAPNGSRFAATDRLSLQPYTSRVLRLQVGDLAPGAYRLAVTGRGGVDFSEEYPLEFVPKSYSVFVQSDRAVYPPGGRMLFRAIVLNSQLKPAAEVRNELLRIRVSDGQGNIVKEWRRVEAIRGVFTGELNIGDRPVLGNWNISVTIHGQTFGKSVEVAEYIKPKFMVTIQAPKHVTFKENEIVANIQTQYTSGKKLKGEATVTLYPTYRSGVIQPIFQSPIRRVLPIDGSLTVAFDLRRDLRLTDEFERTVVLDVVVAEARTARRQNASLAVHLHKYAHRLDLIKTADYFRPGLGYTAYAKVTTQGGAPVGGGEIQVRHGYSRADDLYLTTNHALDAYGVAKLEFETPSNATNTTALRIEAQFGDLKERISPIPAAVSFSGTFLQVTLETDRPIVNLDVEVLVNCTEPMNYVEYVLMGRGDVLIASTFQVDNRKEFRFRFTATHAMVPVAHLIVTYVRSDGELIGDSVDVEVDGLLQNFMEVQVNPVETEPSLDIDITIRSQPNSYIALLAVDQKVHQLRSGFEVTHAQVAEELKRYDLAMDTPYNPILRDSKYHFFWKPGAANPHSAIYESGGDLMTNSHVDRHKPTLEDIYLRPVFYDASTVKPDRGFGLPLHKVTRPPLAGPYAFSRIPRPVWNRPKVHLEAALADTWLFTNFTNGHEGKMSIRRRVPASAGTWVLTGFSLDPLHGLGLVTTPKKVRVARSLAVAIDLPTVLRLGESLAVPVVVHNYNNEDAMVEVTLHNPEHVFEFADNEDVGKVNQTRKIELYRRKKIAVTKNSGNSVSFVITPLRHGSLEIKATANSPKNQDVAIKQLKVIPEGETEYYTKTVLLDLRAASTLKKSINFTLPPNLVPHSEKIEVQAIGDLLGPTIINLERLNPLPTASGVPNLVHIIPSLITLQYLQATRQATPTIENEAVDLLQRAYQSQLDYRHPTGAFSPFGVERDQNGSIFLTAYTALAFTHAKHFVYIDTTVVTAALDWLAAQQAKNGSFAEFAPQITHKHLQNNTLALTAFALLPFIDNQALNPLYLNAINRGLDFIARHIDEHDSTYTIAICAYILQLAKHPSKQVAFNLLDARAKTQNDRKWWSELPSNGSRNPWSKLPRTIDIEMTAFGLLTFIEANYVSDSLPVLNWLLEQQNGFGGFTSSLDTGFGLYAIYKLSVRLSRPVNMEVEFQYKRQESGRFSIGVGNALVVQGRRVGGEIRSMNVTAKGSGLALFRVAYQYNSNVTGMWPLFALDPQVDRSSTRDRMQLSVCAGRARRGGVEVGGREGGGRSEGGRSEGGRSEGGRSEVGGGLVVMEVEVPSGFEVDVDALAGLEAKEGVRRVEVGEGLGKVVMYFENVTSLGEYCPTVSAFRTHRVANLRPVSVIVYDYYDSSSRARLFYKTRRVNFCNICDDDDCGDCTSEPESQVGESQIQESNDKGGAASISSLFSILLLLVVHLVR